MTFAQYRYYIVCPNCRGLVGTPYFPQWDCPWCDGTGWRETNYYTEIEYGYYT